MHSLFNPNLALFDGMPLNVSETQDGYTVQARLPGVARKDIQVDVQGRYLKITVQPSEANPSTSSKRALLSEFHTIGQAERMLQFRDALDAESASLALEDGILTLKVASAIQQNRRTLTLS